MLQVTYHYYMGVFAFLREDYTEAESLFLQSLRMTHIQSARNIELTFDYLIPCLLLRGLLPSTRMLSKSPRLSELYGPFVTAFRTGDVDLFDEQLSKAEKRLMERGTYLVVERAREGAVRGLMKKGCVVAFLFESDATSDSYSIQLDIRREAREAFNSKVSVVLPAWSRNGNRQRGSRMSNSDDDT